MLFLIVANILDVRKSYCVLAISLSVVGKIHCVLVNSLSVVRKSYCVLAKTISVVGKSCCAVAKAISVVGKGCCTSAMSLSVVTKVSTKKICLSALRKEADYGLGEYFLSSGLEEEAEQVVPVRKYKQGEEKEHSNNLCVFEELVARLATGNNLVDKEHHMPAIQRRNWQYVHESKYYT